MDTLGIILGSSVVATTITALINLLIKWIERKWSKNDRIAEIEKKVRKNEIDSVRLQILVLMADYPDDVGEIMRVAEHYFKDLKGNWYMTSMFYKWIQKHDIAKPEWFDAHEE